MSCKSQYVNLEKDQVFKLSSDCPKEGKCKVEVKDEFTYELEKGKGGVINPVFKENTETKLFIFTYSKTKNKELTDDFYQEKILFILPYKIEEGEYSGNDLKDFNISFGKFCFCRDVAGYYPIKTGTLKITKDEIDFTFTVELDQQKIKHISFKIPQ